LPCDHPKPLQGGLPGYTAIRDRSAAIHESCLRNLPLAIAERNGKSRQTIELVLRGTSGQIREPHWVSHLSQKKQPGRPLVPVPPHRNHRG
jgi:hypothetical protein